MSEGRPAVSEGGLAGFDVPILYTFFTREAVTLRIAAARAVLDSSGGFRGIEAVLSLVVWTTRPFAGCRESPTRSILGMRRTANRRREFAEATLQRKSGETTNFSNSADLDVYKGSVTVLLSSQCKLTGTFHQGFGRGEVAFSGENAMDRWVGAPLVAGTFGGITNIPHDRSRCIGRADLAPIHAGSGP